MKKLKIFLVWEFQILEEFLLQTSTFLSDTNANNEDYVTSNGKLTQSEVNLGVSNLVREATLNKLNSIIDFALLTISNHTKSQDVESELSDIIAHMKSSRTNLLNNIKKNTGVKYELIPGWNTVETAREDSNAIKHRGGIHVPKKTIFNVPIYENVNLDKERILEIIQNVKIWMISLLDKIEETYV